MPDTIEKSLSSPDSTKCDKNHLTAAQLCELQRFGARVNKFGAKFAVWSVNGDLVLLCHNGKIITGSDSIEQTGQSKRYIQYAKRCIETDDAVCRSGRHNQVLATILKLDSEAVAVALMDTGDSPHSGYDAIFSEMLELLAENFQTAANAEQQIEMVTTELSQVYEELVLLHKLSTNMRVTESDGNYLQMACDNLTDIVSVEGIAILLEKTIEDEKQLVLAAGSGLIDIDERMAAILENRLLEQINIGKEALLDSEVDSPFKYDWPDNIKNIIAVPLSVKNKAGVDFAKAARNDFSMIGLMVAINRLGKPDFDSPDAKLFNSVANGCAVFIENGKLFKDLKELFIGSLKALTSSIDAKDPYTRGHSERVAFISRWIAEKLAEEEQLEEKYIHKIYLAGLLHDIGKMGINETILCKKDGLTDQEFDHIKTHPSIGAGILSGIKQMNDIIPGILCHHERIDGKGYPDSLVGEQIPLMGKIIGLADSFDAMTSKRTYRGAMTVEQALAEIEKGLGTQFDEKVGKVFINSDVYHLWDIIQDGFNEIYASNFSEYGTVAVGTLIK